MIFTPDELDGSKQEANRYVNVYKNLIRDVKRYFKDAFTDYLNEHGLNINSKLLKTQFLPLFVKIYVDHSFDNYLVTQMLSNHNNNQA